MRMNFATMVHGGQEFEWAEPAVVGDEITTTAKCLEFEKDGKGFYRVRDQFGQPERRPGRARNLDKIIRGV